MPTQVLKLTAPYATLARSQVAQARVCARAAGRAFAVRGWPCRLDHLVADVQRAEPLTVPVDDLGWLSEAAHNELLAFVERYLAHEVADDIRYLVEERVRDGWWKIARSLRQLDDPSQANVRARAHDICRREVSNELKRLRRWLLANPPSDGADPLEGVAAPEFDGPIDSAESDCGVAMLLAALGRASNRIPVQYNAWRLEQSGLTHATIGEQLGFTDRTVRNHLESFQAFVVSDLLERGLPREDIVGLGLGIKRDAVNGLIRKGRKFQRQKKQTRRRRNEQH